MTKICETCIFCKRLFLRLGYKLKPQNFYLCEKRGTFTELKDGCGQWQLKAEKFDISSARFQQAEDDIKAIIEILK